MPTFRIDELDWKDAGEGWSRAELELAEGESLEDPSSTKRLIYGPAKVTLERGPSGAIDGQVDELDPLSRFTPEERAAIDIQKRALDRFARDFWTN